MKSAIFTFLILIFVFNLVPITGAQNHRELQKIQIHKQKRFTKSNLTVKFVSLIDDSRCPVGTNCVWAGNAGIKIEISKGRSRKTFELNTNVGPKAVNFEGYAIEFINLTPVPRENIRIDRNGYVAELAVRKLTK